MTVDTAVLFGGTGFIGTHLAEHFLKTGAARHVVLADIARPRTPPWAPNVARALDDGRSQYAAVDVRQAIAHAGLPVRADLVVNLAAVHREPGHAPHEYHETNVGGATNVCAWAERIGCRQIIFTSSIAPYEFGDEPKDESSPPSPTTPYGASKLEAERIHVAWQHGSADRRLTIVRPGVVFGPGEGGNVTRLVRAVLHRYFCYVGNRGTRKAGGYVSELCAAIPWALSQQAADDAGVLLFNFTMDPPPTVEDYVNATCAVAGVARRVPSLPYAAILSASYVIDVVCRPLGVRQPINPTRIRKLVRSNNIVPRVLRERGYRFRYTLEQALADWRERHPSDWS